MKRIDAITRCKGVLTEMLNRKSSRVMRQVDQAIDAARDNAQAAREKADEIMDSFGCVAESSQTVQLCGKLNQYKDAIIDAKDWDDIADIFEELKKKLQEDVEVEEAA